MAVLAFFLPGVVAFFSLRQAACAIISLIVGLLALALAFTVVPHIIEKSYFSIDLKHIYFAIIYISSWGAAHFILPKSFCANASRQARGVIGVFLLLASLIIVSAIVSAAASSFVREWPPPPMPKHGG